MNRRLGCIRAACLSSLLALGCVAFAPVAHAQAVNAAATLTGSLSAATFSATLLPDNAFVNNGAKVWLALFDANGQGYFYNPQSGWTPYLGGVAPAYGDVTSNRMSIAISPWNVSGSVGGSIYIAYGRSFEEMLANNRFLLVHTIQAPAVTPAPAADALAVHNGTYTCSNLYRTARVTLNLTSSRAVVDVSALYDIPVNTYDVAFNKIDTDGKTRMYASNSFPLKAVFFDPTPGETYPLGIGYTSSSYSTPRLWVCQR